MEVQDDLKIPALTTGPAGMYTGGQTASYDNVTITSEITTFPAVISGTAQSGEGPGLSDGPVHRRLRHLGPHHPPFRNLCRRDPHVRRGLRRARRGRQGHASAGPPRPRRPSVPATGLILRAQDDKDFIHGRFDNANGHQGIQILEFVDGQVSTSQSAPHQVTGKRISCLRVDAEGPVIRPTSAGS